MPEIIQVNRDEWEKYEMDQFSALRYVSTDAGGDYYLNMDNTYLLNELKGVRDQNKSELTKARYTYSMALIAMSVISFFKNNKKDDEDVDIESQVAQITTMISPVLIPMLDSMATLDISDYVA